MGTKERCSAKREIEDNEFLFTKENQQNSGGRIVDKRFESCCKWYIRNACKYKRIYVIMTFIGSVCPIIAAALNGIDFGTKCAAFGKAILIALSLAASISVFVLNVTRAQEKWTNYRVSSEFLKRERTFYLHGKNAHKDDMDAWDEAFLRNIEEYMAQENKSWAAGNQKDSDANKES